MKGSVTHLLTKPETKAQMLKVEEVLISNLEIVGQKKSQPFRTVLLVSKELLERWSVNVGEFRENIVIENFELATLNSGDEIQIGEVKVRVTFFCEPCKNMSHISTVENLKMKRGVLGEFLNDGTIKLNDSFVLLEKKKYEEIPYEYYDRISWYLNSKITGKINAYDLLWNSGVAPGLIRVLGKIMEKHKIKGRERVVFVTHEKF